MDDKLIVALCAVLAPFIVTFAKMVVSLQKRPKKLTFKVDGQTVDLRFDATPAEAQRVVMGSSSGRGKRAAGAQISQ
jgi:hypothetical protein